MGLPRELNILTPGGPIVAAGTVLVTAFDAIVLAPNTYVEIVWLWYSGTTVGTTLELVLAPNIADAIAGLADSEQYYLSTATPQSFYRPCTAVPTIAGSVPHQLYIRQMSDAGRPRIRLAWRIREEP
jgi:hypothetical protein